jgi:hypothetical protein
MVSCFGDYARLPWLGFGLGVPFRGQWGSKRSSKLETTRTVPQICFSVVMRFNARQYAWKLNVGDY